jgi:DNA-binding transcriptional LysR family regulator
MDKLRAMTLLMATAETGSFSAAGRRFGLSAASVSRHISELEVHLGVTLVHRSTRSLIFSEAGQDYLVQAEAILASIDAAEAGVIAHQRVPRGLLRVHSRTMFGLAVLTPIQARFAELYPEVVVELHLSERPARLREEGYDLDFRIAPPQEAGLMRKRLFRSERLLVASPEYVKGMPPLGRPQDLAAHRCLAYWINADTVYWRFLKDGTVEEIALAPAFLSNNGRVLLDAALAGQGVALLDDYTVTADLAAGRLRRLLAGYQVTNSTFDEGIFATYIETTHMPAKLRTYLDFVSDSWAGVLVGAVTARTFS